MGMRQKFIPVLMRDGRPIATREFFPQTFRKAVMQRSRWVTGIGLQSWEFHTVGETLRQIFSEKRGRRIIVACFASHVHRVQQLAGP